MGVPCRLLEGNRVVTEGKGGNLLFVPAAGTGGTVALSPCPYPLGGEYADPDQLTFTKTTAGSDLFVTVLVPFHDAAVPDVTVRLLEVAADAGIVPAWEITGLEIIIAGKRDIYVDTHMHWNLPWRCGGFAGAERVFHSRVAAQRRRK